MNDSVTPSEDRPADDGLDGAHDDLASTFPPAAGPSLAHGYAWRCGAIDASGDGCTEAHSGTADWTDSGIEVCPVHGNRLEYRLP
ncbi:hypothetical protein [Streptomyces sp. HUAS TT20]|uniref:hypothetical protein n=1 Tax=Streptomyces sp. HUAS TT20 TaxID=3447509 RepID=UPI0021D93A75|nr:hypothetical protein [Streptomyces sp. HUAS 15-9]UXY29677.1 hypothetical protein N8I87_26035 [Streptomyces sp. HUAS 15-9]